MRNILLSVSLLLSSTTLLAQNEKNAPVLQLHTSDNIEMMIQNARYTDAVTLLDKEIAQAKRKRKPVETFEEQKKRAEQGLMFLKGTDKVLIIDSTVVDKATFLKAYKFDDELGTVTLESNGSTTRFTTQRGNKVFRSEKDNAGNLQLVSYYQENGFMSQRQVLEGLSVDGDKNYPFLMTDGITFYFSARSAEGLGNYDIYATRYDADTDKFYRAENMGFPYNSYANDYMMVIDEENRIGWFASDRYQPEGKVCIYTFIPNSSRHSYDYESTDPEEIIAAATLKSIKLTWNKQNAQERVVETERIARISSSKKNNATVEFTFILNDNKTLNYFSQFTNTEARDRCHQWIVKQKELTDALNLVESLRTKYAAGDKSQKNKILELEATIVSLYDEIPALEKTIRQLELERK